ncbi:MAG: DUF2627 family protein [Chloroflexota bacterium]|nr:DUF2627 family protein [Chloroflexota bacterium]
MTLPPDLLNNIPEEKRAEFVQYVSEIAVYSHFSGPLPPPDVLNRYDLETQQIIRSESVENRRHRTRMESRRQILLFLWDYLTLGAAFVLALVLINGSIGIIRSGQSIEGLLGIGGSVSLIAGAFLFRDRKRRKVESERAANDNP